MAILRCWRDLNRYSTDRLSCERINRKRMLRKNDLIAGLCNGSSGQLQNIITAITQSDPVRRNAEAIRQHFLELKAIGIGVAT